MISHLENEKVLGASPHPDHIILDELKVPKQVAVKMEHPTWAKWLMAVLLLAAGLCLGIGIYSQFIQKAPEVRIVEKLVFKKPPTPVIDPELKKTIANAIETDNSWLSKAKALGDWFNTRKYTIGGTVLACYGANQIYQRYGDIAALCRTPRIPIDEPETCGGTDEEKSHRKSLNPTKWGPAAWDFLHSVTMGYPDDPNQEEQDAAKDLVRSLKQLLPCHNCRGHFKANLGIFSPKQDYYMSKEKFGKFFADVRKGVEVSKGQSFRSSKTIRAFGKDTGIKVDDFNYDTMEEIYGASCGGKNLGAFPGEKSG